MAIMSATTATTYLSLTLIQSKPRKRKVLCMSKAVRLNIRPYTAAPTPQTLKPCFVSNPKFNVFPAHKGGQVEVRNCKVISLRFFLNHARKLLIDLVSPLTRPHIPFLTNPLFFKSMYEVSTLTLNAYLKLKPSLKT
jgi:hypothetical protein